MKLRTKAALLVAGTAAALPAAAVPASAAAIDYGCHFAAVLDATDTQGPQTWIEVTTSYFVGTPDVTQWQVTCWLQTQPDLDPSGPSEIANTRHTCSGTAPAGACLNPLLFELDPQQPVFQCVHVKWTDSIDVDLDSVPLLVDHVLRDLFSTGGVTTMGGPNQITATVVLAVNNLVATLQDMGVPVTIHPPVSHTVTVDNDPNVAGVQCRQANSAQDAMVL